MIGTALSYSVNPARDAERHQAAVDQLNSSRDAAEQMYREDIKQILTVGIRTIPHSWLRLPQIIGGQVEQVPVVDCISDAITFGKPLEVLMEVLQGSDCPLVQKLRETLEADYSRRNADLLAEFAA